MATVHKSPGSSRHRVQFADSEFRCSCSWQLCLFDMRPGEPPESTHWTIPWGMERDARCVALAHGAKTAGPSLCHGMRPPSLRREDEPHHSCQTVTAQDLCSVFRYGHHLLLEPKEWCCQLSCNLICTKILRTGKRNSPTQRNIIIFSFFELKGRNLNTIIFDMSDLA